MIVQKIYKQLNLWKAERQHKRQFKCYIKKLWKSERQHKRLMKCYIRELNKDPNYINLGGCFSFTPSDVKDIPSLITEALDFRDKQNITST